MVIARRHKVYSNKTVTRCMMQSPQIIQSIYGSSLKMTARQGGSGCAPGPSGTCEQPAARMAPLSPPTQPQGSQYISSLSPTSPLLHGGVEATFTDPERCTMDCCTHDCNTSRSCSLQTQMECLATAAKRQRSLNIVSGSIANTEGVTSRCHESGKTSPLLHLDI